MNYNEPNVIALPRIKDSRGNLSIVENMRQMPFEITHIKWLFNISDTHVISGYHSLACHTLLIALSGSFTAKITTRDNEAVTYSLNNAYSAIFIPAQATADIADFSTNAVAIIIQANATSTSADDQVHQSSSRK